MSQPTDKTNHLGPDRKETYSNLGPTDSEDSSESRPKPWETCKQAPLLRIQGGGSLGRDVWDILAQAALEIEDLYTFEATTRGGANQTNNTSDRYSSLGPHSSPGGRSSSSRNRTNISANCDCDASPRMNNVTSRTPRQRSFNETFNVCAPIRAAPNGTGNRVMVHGSDNCKLFRPHPALVSTMIKPGGRVHLSFSDTVLYSDMDRSVCNTCPRSRNVTIEPTRTGSQTFNVNPPNRTDNHTFNIPHESDVFEPHSASTPQRGRRCPTSRNCTDNNQNLYNSQMRQTRPIPDQRTFDVDTDSRPSQRANNSQYRPNETFDPPRGCSQACNTSSQPARHHGRHHYSTPKKL